MSDLEEIVRATLVGGVEGHGAHADSSRALDGLDWKTAGAIVPESPYSILQVANHIIFWNGYTLAFFRGESPKAPEHDVDGWPGPVAPASEADWTAFVAAYKASLAALTAAVNDRRFVELGRPGGQRTRADLLRAMGNHVSYHVGQIALLRRMLGAWPPPGGGDTW